MISQCSHGVKEGDLCSYCLKASKSVQPVWRRLDQILRHSGYARSAEWPECTIESENGLYQVEQVRVGDTETIQAVQELLEQTFGKEEVDPVAVLVAAIEGKLRDGTQDVARYRLYTARDSAAKFNRFMPAALYKCWTIVDLPLA